MKRCHQPRALSGFSLTELLFSVVILGVITTYTIPKVLHAQELGARKTVFKETIAAIFAIANQGAMTEEFSAGRNGSYVLENLNAVKICNHSLNDGCWAHAIDAAWNFEVTEPGVILHNGAVIAGMNDSNPLNNFAIDWNGSKPPNLPGYDQILVAICTDPDGCAGGHRYRTVVAVSWSGPSVTLFEEIFQ